MTGFLVRTHVFDRDPFGAVRGVDFEWEWGFVSSGSGVLVVLRFVAALSSGWGCM